MSVPSQPSALVRRLPRSRPAFWIACALLLGPLPAQQAEIAKLIGSDTAPGDLLGNSIAIDGDTAMVGAWNRPLSGLLGVGAVYVFTRTNGVWSEQQKLLITDPAEEDRFGSCIALQGDTAVIGARSKDGPGMDGAGAAYVFTRSGGVWSEEQKLLPADTRDNIFFGHCVSLDGDTLLVGASAGRDPAGTAVGAAYFFERIGGVFVQQQKLTGAGFLFAGQFGNSVALDGDTAAIGTWGLPVSGQDRAGEVQVFVRSGGTWTLQQSLVSGGPTTFGKFGFSLSLDGDRLAIGAPGEFSSGILSGQTWMSERSGGSWGTPQVLSASDPSANSNFGFAVALRGDTLIVGSPDALGSSGAGYTFRLAAGVWSEVTQLVASDRVSGFPDQLGASVAYDGNTATLGAIWDSHGAGPAGSAYVFDAPSGGGSGGAATAPRDVALGDADGDGDLDAVTANSGTDDLGLWLGDGAGQLAAPVAVALTAGDLAPVAAAFGDLDGDGAHDDVAVACADSHSVAVVLDVGTTAVASSRSAGGLRPNDVVCADFDASGTDDVVVARGGEPIGGGAGVAIALDGGAFVELSIPPGTARSAVKLAVGDLDGDGDLDLAVVAQGATDQLLLFANDGSGGLTLAGSIALTTSGFANGLCCGDLDGDGDLDLAVVQPVLFPAPGSTLQAFRYTGSGPLDATDYSASPVLATSGSFATDVVCGDFDADSIAGLARPDFAVVHAGSGDVEALFGFDVLAGTAASTLAVPVGTNPIAAAIGDLDADGADDLVVANQGSDDVTVVLGEHAAVTATYGSGCPGTGGLTPLLDALGLPTTGNATFGLQLSQARAVAPWILVFSGMPDSTPLGGGCTLLVGAPLVSVLRFTNVLGEDDYFFGVPNQTSLVGLQLYFQGAVFDPNGAFAATLALSNGVRVQVGG